MKQLTNYTENLVPCLVPVWPGKVTVRYMLASSAVAIRNKFVQIEKCVKTQLCITASILAFCIQELVGAVI